MRNYDKDFATDADYADGFVESDATKWEREQRGAKIPEVSGTNPSFDFNAAPIEPLETEYEKNLEKESDKDNRNGSNVSEFADDHSDEVEITEDELKAMMTPSVEVTETIMDDEPSDDDYEHPQVQEAMNTAQRIDESMTARERYEKLSVEDAKNMSDEELSELARQAQEEAEDAYDVPN